MGSRSSSIDRHANKLDEVMETMPGHWKDGPGNLDYSQMCVLGHIAVAHGLDWEDEPYHELNKLDDVKAVATVIREQYPDWFKSRNVNGILMSSSRYSEICFEFNDEQEDEEEVLRVVDKARARRAEE